MYRDISFSFFFCQAGSFFLVSVFCLHVNGVFEYLWRGPLKIPRVAETLKNRQSAIFEACYDSTMGGKQSRH